MAYALGEYIGSEVIPPLVAGVTGYEVGPEIDKAAKYLGHELKEGYNMVFGRRKLLGKRGHRQHHHHRSYKRSKYRRRARTKRRSGGHEGYRTHTLYNDSYTALGNKEHLTNIAVGDIDGSRDGIRIQPLKLTMWCRYSIGLNTADRYCKVLIVQFQRYFYSGAAQADIPATNKFFIDPTTVDTQANWGGPNYPLARQERKIYKVLYQKTIHVRGTGHAQPGTGVKYFKIKLNRKKFDSIRYKPGTDDEEGGAIYLYVWHSDVTTTAPTLLCFSRLRYMP